MQRRAQNLLHCISPQTHTHAPCEDILSCTQTRVTIRFSSVTYREDPLWVALGPHVGVVDLLKDHPRLVMFPILEEKKKEIIVHVSQRSCCKTPWK